jgi:hypothetical protein
MSLLPDGPCRRMVSVVDTMESSMSKAGLDRRHRNTDGEISGKHGNTLVGTLRKSADRVLLPVIRKLRS